MTSHRIKAVANSIDLRASLALTESEGKLPSLLTGKAPARAGPSVWKVQLTAWQKLWNQLSLIGSPSASASQCKRIFGQAIDGTNMFWWTTSKQTQDHYIPSWPQLVGHLSQCSEPPTTSELMGCSSNFRSAERRLHEARDELVISSKFENRTVHDLGISRKNRNRGKTH